MQVTSSTHESTWTETLGAVATVAFGHAKDRVKRLMRRSGKPGIELACAMRGLHRDGFFIIPDYLDRDSCASARAQIDKLIGDQPDAVQRFGNGSDCRVYAAELASAAARQFHDDTFCLSAGRMYRRAPLVNFSTLAARLTAAPGNLGSGQGWHRDAFHFQFKAMVYLSDVGAENGPFQILPRSHRGFQVARDTLVGRLERPPASRISDQQIARLLKNNSGRAKPLPGAAGTLILFDSSAIHRGMPIQSGTRYALTNYYYPPESVTPDLYRHFAPLAHS